MAIYKKLAQIQGEIRGLAKNKDAFNYDYLTGDKLLGEVRPRMVALGLLLMPEVTEVVTEPITYASWNKTAKAWENKTEVLATVSMKMTWVDSEDGETLVQQWAATGMNAFDKGFGSALTYGERYYLLKLFHIPSDKDDVDAVSTIRDAAMAGEGAERKSKKAAEKPAGKPVADEPPATETEALQKANDAATLKELTEVWNKYKKWYGAKGSQFEAVVKSKNHKFKEEKHE